MGRKVNPIAIRMGINKGWNAVWYSDKKNFPRIFMQDLKIEEKIKETMKDSGIDRVEINRFANKVEVIV
ncbi:MAG TPA: 30S ribosomal protein S3, partial [Candidatus Dojkabacteria bacterium]|nr:30S ribosomal protein S3 [Candidatus Dojkabacteria bacterium]